MIFHSITQGPKGRIKIQGVKPKVFDASQINSSCRGAHWPSG